MRTKNCGNCGTEHDTNGKCPVCNPIQTQGCVIPYVEVQRGVETPSAIYPLHDFVILVFKNNEMLVMFGRN